MLFQNDVSCYHLNVRGLRRRWWTLRCALFSLFMCTIFSQSLSQPPVNGRIKFVGNVIHSGYSIHPDFSTSWNQVTPENAGKWGSVETSQGVYSWTELDDIYNYALAHGFPYKHHNLIWGSQQPGFMISGYLDSAQQYREIVNWIDSSGARYPRRISAMLSTNRFTRLLRISMLWEEGVKRAGIG